MGPALKLVKKKKRGRTRRTGNWQKQRDGDGNAWGHARCRARSGAKEWEGKSSPQMPLKVYRGCWEGKPGLKPTWDPWRRITPRGRGRDPGKAKRTTSFIP